MKLAAPAQQPCRTRGENEKKIARLSHAFLLVVSTSASLP
jgi:hypothetical protein